MKLMTRLYQFGTAALVLALAAIFYPSAFSPLFADPSPTTAAPVVTTGSYPAMTVGRSGTATCALDSGTAGLVVNTGTSNGTLGASGTGSGSVPLWNGTPIGITPGAQLFDASGVLEIDLGARHFLFENGSAVAIDLTGTGRNANASLSFNGTGGVYTKNNTLDDGNGNGQLDAGTYVSLPPASQYGTVTIGRVSGGGNNGAGFTIFNDNLGSDIIGCTVNGDALFVASFAGNGNLAMFDSGRTGCESEPGFVENASGYFGCGSIWVDGGAAGFDEDGKPVLTDDSTTPTNSSTPAGYIHSTIGGSDAWIPYYR
jgi:hypothetical protein